MLEWISFLGFFYNIFSFYYKVLEVLEASDLFNVLKLHNIWSYRIYQKYNEGIKSQ